ncbi:MAG: 16S rRNA (guanine(966)-N(2))-methyltransferase RsmD [Flavobacteriales bacterium]
MRIIGGSLKGKIITVPAGFPSRPTTDFAREGLFNLLGNTQDFTETRVLDLYTGTGCISYEFYSRGANSITMVDCNTRVLKNLLKINEKLNATQAIQVVKSDAIHFLKKTSSVFDLIFSDPPFDDHHHAEIVALVFERKILQKDGLLIVEHGKQTDLSEETYFKSSRKFGNVIFSFFAWE